LILLDGGRGGAMPPHQLISERGENSGTFRKFPVSPDRIELFFVGKS
jgi:hypothetical protein